MPLMEDSPVEVESHTRVSNMMSRPGTVYLELESIPETVTAELALVLGDGRLVEAVEGGLAIGLRALMAHVRVDLWV